MRLSSEWFMDTYISLFTDYLKHERNFSEHTVKNYHSDLLQFRDFLLSLGQSFQLEQSKQPTIDIRRIEQLKEGEEVQGNRTRVKVVKNKLASPFQEAEFDVGGNGAALGVDDRREALGQFPRQLHELLTRPKPNTGTELVPGNKT